MVGRDDGPRYEQPVPWWLRGFVLDLRSLALFRVAIGLCCLGNMLLRLPQIEAFYTDQGVLPRAALVRLRDPLLSLHMVSGEWAIQMAIALLSIVFSAGLIAGYRTRLSTIMCWALVTSMQARNPMVAHGGDHVLRVVLFWAIFFPLSGRRSAGVEGKRNVHLSPAGVALILQVCAIYWFAFAEKMDPGWLTERSAVYYALHLDMFATPIANVLRDLPELTRLLTVATLAIEFLGPFLAISPILPAPLRLLAVVGFIGFHAGLGLTMRLGTFPWICAAAWLALLPATVWRGRDRLPRWLGGEPAREVGPFGGLIAVVAVLLLALSLLAPTLRPEKPSDASVLERSLSLLGLVQRWPMFAPHPTAEDGWYVMRGLTQSGRRVDVWDPGSPPTDEKPADFGAAYGDARWLGYLYVLRGERHAPFREHLGRYLCRRWNAGHPDELDSVSIVFMRELTPPPGLKGSGPEEQIIRDQACP
jgi:hypothetical protein